jgi:hypothetical protein
MGIEYDLYGGDDMIDHTAPVTKIVFDPPKALINNLERYMHEAYREYCEHTDRKPHMFMLSRMAVAASKIVIRDKFELGYQSPPMFEGRTMTVFRGWYDIPCQCDPSQTCAVRAIGDTEESFITGYEVRRG